MFVAHLEVRWQGQQSGLPSTVELGITFGLSGSAASTLPAELSCQLLPDYREHLCPNEN